MQNDFLYFIQTRFVLQIFYNASYINKLTLDIQSNIWLGYDGLR